MWGIAATDFQGGGGKRKSNGEGGGKRRGSKRLKNWVPEGGEEKNGELIGVGGLKISSPQTERRKERPKQKKRTPRGYSREENGEYCLGKE